jgi:hypothetical protein
MGPKGMLRRTLVNYANSNTQQRPRTLSASRNTWITLPRVCYRCMTPWWVG